MPSRPWRAQLRVRVLVGVLLIILIALAAFDVAAITAQRRYLLDQTDATLQTVLAVAFPRFISLIPKEQININVAPGWVDPSQEHLGPGSPPPSTAASTAPDTRPAVSTTPAAPPPASRPASASPAPGSTSGAPRTGAHSSQIVPVQAIQNQYYVGFVTNDGQILTFQVGPGLAPNLPAEPSVPANLSALATEKTAETVISHDGRDELRIRAERVGLGYLVVSTSLDQVTRTVGQLQLILTIGSAAVLLVLGLGVFGLLRRGLRPIETMAAQADRVTAGDITAGDLTDRVAPEDTGSEVGRLGAALQGMLARIEAGIHEREADQQVMRQFFADASHELRTPLASLRANAELYQQGALRERTEIDEVMRRIGLEAERMSRLVDDMLRLARLDQHPEQQRAPVDLSDLLAGCVERARIAEPSRTWRADIAAGLLTTGDEELLRRAVDNLVANVHAHTPAGTVAELTATARDGVITVEVSDDGPGVPPGQLPRIFDRFYRSGNRSSRPGAGLGLAIVAEIAAAHHGSVEATGNEPRGLRVRLSVPQATDDSGADGEIRDPD